MASTWAATFSARPCSRAAPSAWITLATPAILEAACAAAPALWPATRTCTSPPHWAAAVTVLRVAPLRLALSCSAITREVMSVVFLLNLGGCRHQPRSSITRGRCAGHRGRAAPHRGCRPPGGKARSGSGGSNDLRFVLELVDQGGDIGHLDACAALGGFLHLDRLEARGDVYAEVFGLDGVELLFLGLHDVGQGDVARLGQAQGGGDHGGERGGP